MNQARPERGTKRTCQSCESRFYDLGRVPAICPKCGVEYVEIVRPPPVRRPIRGLGAFGAGRPGQPFAVAQAEEPAVRELPEDDREPGEDGEEEPEDEAEPDSEVEDPEE